MTNENEDVKRIYTPEFKEKWFGSGEWVDEPDVVKFDYIGYKCMVYRVVKQEPYAKEEHWFGGHLCGYVLLPEGHKFYGLSYNDIDVDCHGGLTFSEFNQDWDKLPNGHLIGFDCAHSGDYCPSSEKFRDTHRVKTIFPIDEELKKYSIFNPVYRNIQFCMDECKSIVDQLVKLENCSEN